LYGASYYEWKINNKEVIANCRQKQYERQLRQKNKKPTTFIVPKNQKDHFWNIKRHLRNKRESVISITAAFIID
jgi:hypothetical protein